MIKFVNENYLRDHYLKNKLSETKRKKKIFTGTKKLI